MSEWKEVKLGDLVSIKYGKDHKSLSDGVFPVFGSGGLMRKVDSYIYDKPSLLIPRKGTLNNIIYTEEKFWTVDTMFWTKVDELKTSAKFLYYYLKDFNFNALNVGSAVPSLTVPVLNDIDIKLPSTDKQSDIVGILSSLDAKIETNNKLNEKLEEMAQAIFKSWFVDFEPFKDKPFHDTELGMIPEGWEVSTFSSIIEKLISGDWGKETPTGNYVHKVACIRGCDFENIKNGLRGKTPERFILERNFALKQPKPNDIVVEMSGGTATVSTGRICYITKELLDQYEGDIVCTNFCKIVRPLKGWSQYLYYYWQYKYDKKVMFCYENGTSGIKNFAINDFIDFESILIPPKDELIKFNSIIDNIRVKIQMNGVENTRLASLRDTLLPRLMSGELIV
ncbi:MAG: restriction endonuclease subunit S [Prevotella sp.]|nr:restriction endonuclease subunit S [Prevotella sp.]